MCKVVEFFTVGILIYWYDTECRAYMLKDGMYERKIQDERQKSYLEGKVGNSRL
jgi:hypothetical protein